jgi:quercetin dioxygenase-like cupin family protein
LEKKGETTMASVKPFSLLGLIFYLLAIFATCGYAGEGDTTWQINTPLDEILKANPLPAGDKSQMIKLAEDDSVGVYLVRMAPGAELGPHFHRTHDETEYVIRGSGQLLVNDNWVDINPGSFHFNPKSKVHGAKNTADEPLVVLIMFTPAMREVDRHFLK